MAARDSHCGIQGCRCTHDQGCYQGWIENDTWKESKHVVRGGDGIERPATTDSVRPCPTCRPEQAEAVNLASDREEQSRMLRARGRRGRREQYEHEQGERTRTL